MRLFPRGVSNGFYLLCHCVSARTPLGFAFLTFPAAILDVREVAKSAVHISTLPRRDGREDSGAVRAGGGAPRDCRSCAPPKVGGPACPASGPLKALGGCPATVGGRLPLFFPPLYVRAFYIRAYLLLYQGVFDKGG